MGRMDCRQCRKWWSPYLDSELDASTTFEVSEHLRACAACRKRFEREAGFENHLRERFRNGNMPAAVWMSLCQKVRGERGQQRRDKRPALRFPFGKVLAVAASVLFLATGTWYYARWLDGDFDPAKRLARAIRENEQSISDILQDRAPTLVAFTDTPEADFDEHLASLSRDMFGAVVSIDPALSGGHKMELIGVAERTDSIGVHYIEAWLNCCNRPVLLALSRPRCNSCIVELRGATGGCEKGSRSGTPKSPPIKTESIERGGVLIAAATADHYLTGLLESIIVTPL